MRYALAAFCSLLLFASCQKDELNTNPDANVRISEDTLHFDTVFTQTGSVTQAFKIKNEEESRINISSVQLMGGNSSAFRININGAAGPEVSNIEIPGNDSIYVFVSVFIDPSSAQLPFLVQDSIRLLYNGTERFVQLEAFGQNAHFLRDSVISGNQTWVNDLPYVILSGLKVDSSARLSLSAGCRLYFHGDAGMNIYGSLVVNGTATERVIFTGDRLDDYYRDLPASWSGMFFSESSRNNNLNYAVIKNAYDAITILNPAPGNAKLQLNQCIIDNAYEYGLKSVNSNLTADNCLFSNCGKNIEILQGGDYTFTNCTVAAFSTQYGIHKYPVAFVSDAALYNGNPISAPLQASFINCIFWGDNGTVQNEIITEKKGTNFVLQLDHCLFKAVADPANATFVNVIRNQDPVFDSIDAGNNFYDFHITKDAAAPGINAGVATLLTTDLDGLDRNIGLPDLGCYEKQ